MGGRTRNRNYGYGIFGMDEPEEEVFQSSMTILETPLVLVPMGVYERCIAVQSKFRDLEVSMLLKGKWTSKGFEIDRDAYAIPKQKVGMASVDYDHRDLMRLKAEGYNVVMHSHPASIRSFSPDDEQSINVHFEASILLCDGAFTDCNMSFKVAPRLKLRLDGEVEVIPSEMTILGIENIEEKPVPPPKTYKKERMLEAIDGRGGYPNMVTVFDQMENIDEDELALYNEIYGGMPPGMRLK